MNNVLRIVLIILSFVLAACVAGPRPYPWNFPDEAEWNQPFETSWQNAVDMYRRLTAPKGKVWDPLMENYQTDLSYGYQ